MPLEYHAVYNERAVAASEPFNKEALQYLDDHFKERVTAVVDGCLAEAPADPVRFIADRLRASIEGDGSDEASGPALPRSADKAVLLHLSNGLPCELRPANTWRRAPTVVVPHLPIVQLHCPSVYDMERALALVQELVGGGDEPTEDVHQGGEGTDCGGDVKPSAQTPLLVIVEPPSAPEEVVFLKGIPYVHRLTQSLEQQARRHRAHRYGTDQEGPALQALQVLQRALGEEDVAGFEASLEEVFGEQGAALPSHPSRPHTALVMLPSVQKNYMAAFDAIDAGFRQLARAPPGSLAAARPVPTVLHVSFNEEQAPLTVARIVAAFVPYYETAQLSRLAEMREESIAKARHYSLDFCKSYWREVHRRREAEDQLTAASVAARKRAGSGGGGGRARTRSPTPIGGNGSMSPASTTGRLGASAVSVSATIPAAAAPPPPPVWTVAQQKVRDLRRQQEDTAFLAVLGSLKSLAVTRVQTNVRGCFSRRKCRSEATTPRTDAGRAATAALTMPYPPTLPPLLFLVAQRLERVHGEVFGNYAATPSPEPRELPTYIPERRRAVPTKEESAPAAGAVAAAQDTSSEALHFPYEVQLWTMELVPVPPRRSCVRRAHFNPLARLLDYYRLCGCDALDEALLAQRQLGGLSTLQQRAYSRLKSVALDLLHVAHAELCHRNALPPDQCVFSNFVARYHGDVLAWFSQPHLVSSAALQQRRSDRVGGGHGGAAPVVMAAPPAIEHERVLVPGFTNLASGTTFPPRSGTPVTASMARPTQAVQIAAHLFLTDAALPVAAYRDAVVGVAAVAAGGADGGGGGGEVALINLCPQPTVYVAGHALVLAPVGAAQRVAGRPKSNQFVLRVNIESGGQRQHDGVTIVPSQPPARALQFGAHRSRRHPTAEDEVAADGPPQTASAADTVCPVPCSPLRTHLGGTDLHTEEVALAQYLRGRLRDHGALQIHEPAGDQTSSSPVHYTAALRSESLALRCVSVADLCAALSPLSSRGGTDRDSNASLSSAALVPRRPDRARVGRVTGVGSPLGSGACIPTAGPDQVTSPMSASRSALYRSAGPLLSSPSTSPTTSPLRTRAGLADPQTATAAPPRPLTFEDLDPAAIVPSQTAFAALAQELAAVDSAMARLTYTHLWLPSGLAGDVWVQRLDAFVESTAVLLKQAMRPSEEGEWDATPRRGPAAVLLAAQPNCADQLVFVAAAALVSGAVDAWRAPRPPGIGGERAAPGNATSGSNGRPGAAGFLTGFYALLHTAVGKAGVNVGECVAEVSRLLSELNALNSDAAWTLADIDELVRTAETTSNPADCRAAILTAAQRTEQFCWLLLLQVFLACPFNHSGLDPSRMVPLNPFGNFVQTLDGVKQWMQTMDPWADGPERCPDSAHPRYSNGLRRWDCTNYICFGAIDM